MAKPRNDFTDILVRKKQISPDQITEALSMMKDMGLKLPDTIIKLGYCTPKDVIEAIAEHHNLEFVDLQELNIPPAVIENVPESIARENVVLPVAIDNNVLKMVISDPMDLDKIQNLQFILNKELQPVLAPREQIIEAINRFYGQSETESVDSMLQEFTDTAIDTTEMEKGGAAQAAKEEADAPIVKLVNLIIAEAIGLRTSDIHIEPFETRVRIRYRIDGVLVERDSPPKRLLPAITSRIKIMANMDIAEKRRCQDGRLKTMVNGKHYDMRVNMLPTNHGQATCMRILDRSNIMVSIRDLGFAEDDYATFNTLIKRPNGIFLVCGPTGSGKTTTLYAALNELNRPDKKIITAEDPVEYYLPGVNQCEVKHNIGLNFARIIRSMLRQAPNVILVGEIRDKETAEIAIQASITGHFVFSTLHTNDAPSSVTRLIDIGVPPYMVAASVVAVLAQRLGRRVCAKCKVPDTPPKSDIAAAGIPEDKLVGATFMRGQGCPNCNNGGYRGRVGIYELLRMTAPIRQLTFRKEPAQNIRKQACELGMKTLLQDGANKCLKGMTTLEEILSICHHDENAAH